MTTTELLGPLADPGARVFAPFLLASAAIAAAFFVARRRTLRGLVAYVIPKRIWLHPSSRLDAQLAAAQGLLRVALGAPALVTAAGVAAATARGLDDVLGVPAWSAPPLLLAAAYSLSLFVASDLSRWALHRALHEVPALWQLHQVHHSAEVLTPLTYYRTHPLEAALYEARGALATGLVAGAFFHGFRGEAVPWTLAGVSALGFVANALGGNLRHSHVWLGYGPVERWLISPAQHQLHHADDGCNHGAWLAIWDRLAGTWRRSSAGRPTAFGLPAVARNHRPDDLFSALVAPLVAALRRAPATGALVLLALAPGPAAAADGGRVSGDGAPAEAAPDRPAESEPEDTEPEDAEPEDAEPEDTEPEDTEPEDAEPEDAEPSVGEVVSVVATRRGLPRVAGSAHVVGEEELERYEYDDIHRVLAPVPGVYVREEDGFGLRPNIGLRGASSDRSAKITLMEDGILLGPAPYSAPAAYYFPLTTRMVGVEVFKGPAATRHGPNTIGGAINMQTRPLSEEPSLALDAAVGLRRTWKLHGYGGFGGARGGLLVEAGHVASGGFKQLDSGGPTGFDKTEVMIKGGLWDPRGAFARNRLELKLGYANELSRETYLGLTDSDFAATPDRRYASSSEGRMAWNRTQVELAWGLRVGSAFRLRVVGYHHWMDRSWTKLNGFTDGPDVADVLAFPEGGQNAVYQAVLSGQEDTDATGIHLAIGTNHRSYHSAGVQALMHLEGRTGPLGHELEVGVRLHGDRIRRQHDEAPWAMSSGRVAPTADPHPITDNMGEALALAVHVHEDLSVGPLRLLPSFRVEGIQTRFDDALHGHATAATRWVPLPGLGLHVQPTPWLSLLGGVHRGFSPVSPGQAADTKPETSANVEAGARFALGGTRAEAIGFLNDYSNLTGNCTFSSGCGNDLIDTQFNAGRVLVWGGEFVVEQRIRLPLAMELNFRGTYTATGSRFQSSFVSPSPQFGRVREGDELPYVPEHRGSASAGYVTPWFSIEATAKGQTAMRDLPGQGPIEERLKLPAYVVVDLAAEGRILDGIRVYGTVNNLTNARYLVSRRPFGARPGAPFTFLLGVKLNPDLRRLPRPSPPA